MKKQSYCQITEHTEVMPGTMRMTVIEPDIAAASRPGQFVNVICGPCMDPLLRRPLSIYSVDKNRGEFSILYQVRGRGTVMLSQKKVGEKLDVVGPIGRSFDIDPSENVEHILVGGGCGIVPLLFLADVLQEEAKGKVVVLIGAQTAGSILCASEFVDRDLPVELTTDDGTAGKQGFVTDTLIEHLNNLDKKTQPRIYACGPHEMLKQIAKIAANPQPSTILDASACSSKPKPTVVMPASAPKNEPKHRVSLPSTLNPQPIPCQVSLESAMACGFGVCMGCVTKTHDPNCDCHDWSYKRVCVDGPVFYTTELIWE
ncbi:MAG: dihydroorotate dehydrogenase electron transfer subunit [Armatimonadota bacterium]|nr:dihydroorotate dehydrogenase electron transfer subunit [Armatimonadota bacterium]